MLEAMILTENKYSIIIDPLPNYTTIVHKFDNILGYTKNNVIINDSTYDCILLRYISLLDIDINHKTVSRKAIDDIIKIIYNKYKNQGYILNINNRQAIVEINLNCEEIVNRIDTQRILNEVCYSLYIDELQLLKTSPIVNKIKKEVERLINVRFKRISNIVTQKRIFTMKCLINFITYSTYEIIVTKDILTLYLAELISYDDYKHNFKISRDIITTILDDNVKRCLEYGYYIIYV
jgi:hypothetical protein